jgi:hypothetical protein
MAAIETTKTRTREFYKFSGFESQQHFISGFTTQDKSFSIVGRQATTSTGNPHHLIGRTDRDIGARFITRDQFLTVDGVEMSPYGGTSIKKYSLDVTVSGARRRYVGPRLAIGPQTALVDFPLPLTPETSALNALGATAISRTIPTRPDASLAVFLGELKEGMPSIVGSQLWRSRVKDFRALGGEYLNFKFGWESLVNDIKSFFTAVVDGERILTQLERDSGKNVRRSYYFTPVQTLEQTNVSTSQGLYPILTSTLNPPNGTLTTHKLTEEKVWFKGCYTYYLSPKTRDRVANVARYADHILGLDLTPEVVWELTPWSWVADYFANVGDVMTNVSYFSQDNLLLRYGYVMKTKKVGWEYTWTGSIPGYGPTTTSLSVGNITKQRVRATPYGFGFDTGGLNPAQWAILVALGIARAPQSL